MPRVDVGARRAVKAPLTARRLGTNQFAERRWRMIGPFRACRTKAAVGIPDQSNVFYIGAVDGGVWKSGDAGRTWVQRFDAQVVRCTALSRVRLAAINVLLTRARLQPITVPH